MNRRLACWRILLVFSLSCLWSGPVFAQEAVNRLPAIDATRSNPALFDYNRLGAKPPQVEPLLPARRNALDYPPAGGAYPDRLYDLRPDPSAPDALLPAGIDAAGIGAAGVGRPNPGRLSSYKDGFFQKLELIGTWLPDDSANGMEITELEVLLTVALPLPNKDNPLLITPAFETRFLEGPQVPDLPGTLYSAYTQFIWVPKLAGQWSAILGIEPGAYGDFESGDQDVFRLLGRALIRYEWVPDQLELIAGVLYLDRPDVELLPAGGVIWSPCDDIRYEILFPRPKFAHRTYFDGIVEYWVYLGGEFGGDSWAIQRANGALDQLMLRDVRVTLGLEKKLDGGAGYAVEVGYVFSRQIELESTVQEFDLEDTLMLRGIIRY